MGGTQETHKNQGGVEIFIASSHVLGVVLHCLPFVHAACVEIELWIGLDRLEVHSLGHLDTATFESAAVDPASVECNTEGQY